MSAPTLTRVTRLDAMPFGATYYTAEGFLRDSPILTSTGIFEYTNYDGSKRRELRLPEDVFDPESLASYLGKPVVISHDAGLIDKNNVSENSIGTIISKGYQSGNDVRADIVIHDTDDMKSCGFKELSLGYSLDLDETPGVWNGERYDAVQKNIRINHLALVREARAGEQARLNIDSRDAKTLIGGKVMKKNPKKTSRADGILSPEELEKAIKEYKAKRASEVQADEDKPEKAVESVAVEEKEVAAEVPAEETPAVAEETPAEVEEEPLVVEEDEDDEEEVTEPVEEPETVEEQVAVLKENRDRRDEDGDPKDVDDAMVTIAHQDEDIQKLFDIIDTLLAQRDFKESKEDSADEDIPDAEKGDVPFEAEPKCDGKNCDSEDVLVEEEVNEDEDDEIVEEEVVEEPVEEVNEDEDEEEEDDEEEELRVNTDSVDEIVRTKVNLGMLGRGLGIEGLENLKIKTAKKAIISAVRPNMRLDGKSDTFVNVAFDMAVAEIEAKSVKDTNYQLKQMFNCDAATVKSNDIPSATEARQRMIDRQQRKNKEEK